MSNTILILSKETPSEYAGNTGEARNVLAAVQATMPAGWEAKIVCAASNAADLAPRSEYPEIVRSFYRATLLADTLAYAVAESIPVIVVIGDEPHYKDRVLHESAMAQGVQFIVPYSYDNIARRLRVIDSMWAAITVSGGINSNAHGYGPGLEVWSALPSGITAQSETCGYVAGIFARILAENPTYILGDARQHLRELASKYTQGWTEANGYGKVTAYAAKASLQVAPPLSISATVNSARTEVTFNWVKFPQTGVNTTLIKDATGVTLYSGTATTATLPLTTDGDVVFYFHHQRADLVVSPTSLAARIVVFDGKADSVSVVAYVKGRLLDPRGEPRAGIAVLFVPVSVLSSDPEYVSKMSVTAQTDADGFVYNLDNIKQVALRSGTYRVRIAGIDVYTVTVPSEAGTYNLTSLISSI